MTAAGAWHPDPIGEASWRLWDGASWSSETAPAGQAQVAPLTNALGRSLQLDEQGKVLYCDGSPVALMHRRTIGDTTGETASGAWTFDRKGIVNDSISVLVQPSQQEIARFAWDGPGTGTSGNLQFPDGRWFRR